MTVAAVVRDVASRLSPDVLAARIRRGDMRTPRLTVANARHFDGPNRPAMRVRDTDDAEPRFEKVTHG